MDMCWSEQHLQRLQHNKRIQQAVWVLNPSCVIHMHDDVVVAPCFGLNSSSSYIEEEETQQQQQLEICMLLCNA